MGRTIATQYGKRNFGRVDPFCAFAVVPLLIVAGLFFWSGIALIGITLILFTAGVVVFDAWTNRPATPDPRPRYRDDR